MMSHIRNYVYIVNKSYNKSSLFETLSVAFSFIFTMILSSLYIYLWVNLITDRTHQAHKYMSKTKDESPISWTDFHNNQWSGQLVQKHDNRSSGLQLLQHHPRWKTLYCVFSVSSEEEPVPGQARGQSWSTALQLAAMFNCRHVCRNVNVLVF